MPFDKLIWNLVVGEDIRTKVPPDAQVETKNDDDDDDDANEAEAQEEDKPAFEEAEVQEAKEE